MGIELTARALNLHLRFLQLHQKIRATELEGVAYLLQQLDFTRPELAPPPPLPTGDEEDAASAMAPPAPTASAREVLLPLVEQLRAKADKWTKHSDLQGVCYRILSIVLVRLPAELFATQHPAHLQRLLKLVRSEDTKNVSLVALITMLRGLYAPAELGWTPGMKLACGEGGSLFV